MTSPVDIIQRKRDGGEHSAVELAGFIQAFMDGEVADYQMSAWLMAALLKGLSRSETLALTDALLDSGKRLDLSPLGRRVVDKHSTGGVGDKVTMVLGPLVASCGAVFGKMSGRGLGHTGGTIDKLESIPGFRTSLSAEDFVGQLGETGICVAGQSADLAPADNRLYALRDVTATVESNPLIAASIISKKLAGGANAVVLDVKVGKGSFFKTMGHAQGVAHLMREVGGTPWSRRRGDHDLDGATAGPRRRQHPGGARGGRDTRGKGPSDLVEVVVTLGARLLVLSDPGWEAPRAEAEARRALADGSALAKFREWITAQGGDASFIDDPSALPVASIEIEIQAPSQGWIEAIDARAVGRAAAELGAGRQRKEGSIDHSVGVRLKLKQGDPVMPGQALASVYATEKSKGQRAAGMIQEAYRISESRVEPAPVLLLE